MFNKRVALNPDKTLPASLLPGPSRRLALVLKCRWFVFFNVTLLGIYRWLRYITGSLKSYPPFWKVRGMEDSQEKDYSFLGNLYDALVYERKFKSEYLERQIYERSLKSEPSIVKLIESKSDLSKLSTLSEHLSRIKANTYQS